MEQAVHQVKTADRYNHGMGFPRRLHNFYQANLRAIERGVKITRIFVVKRENLADTDSRRFSSPSAMVVLMYACLPRLNSHRQPTSPAGIPTVPLILLSTTTGNYRCLQQAGKILRQKNQRTYGSGQIYPSVRTCRAQRICCYHGGR